MQKSNSTHKFPNLIAAMIYKYQSAMHFWGLCAMAILVRSSIMGPCQHSRAYDEVPG